MDLLEFCRDNQIEVECDVAIEPEDYQQRILTDYTLDAELLGLLAGHDVEFTITIYGRFTRQE